jgi:hypothetical protein
MSHVVLITSAAYVEPELEAEFGHIPPAFLPLGNRRLFVHQRAVFEEVPVRILLSLPEDFVPEVMDLDLLHRLNIEVVPVPGGLSLGQSIVYVINMTATAGCQLSLLHGDTLIPGLDLQQQDVVSVSAGVPPGYRWGYVEAANGQLDLCMPESRPDTAVALSGYFAFGDTARLVQSITRKGGKFLEGLADYSRAYPMKTIASKKWFDFGHVNTYHQSRQAVTTQRAFNTLVASRRDISKSGINPRKIEAESRWFESLPPSMRVYTPAFLGMRKDGSALSYGVEYLHLPTLSDLFVFGRLPARAWENILDSCTEFLDACAVHASPGAALSTSQTLYGGKTLSRLEQFARQSGVSLSAPCRFGGVWLPSLEQMANLASAAIPEPQQRKPTLVHGDFCFSNILYDFRADGIRVIDPRGLDANDEFSVFGDIRYDIGKLHHSAVGKYDLIMAGYYELTQGGPLDFALTLPDNASTRALADAFSRQVFAGYRSNDAAAPAICVLLFLSMLPLHGDDPRRQSALLANAMRLFLACDQLGKP